MFGFEQLEELIQSVFSKISFKGKPEDLVQELYEKKQFKAKVWAPKSTLDRLLQIVHFYNLDFYSLDFTKSYNTNVNRINLYRICLLRQECRNINNDQTELKALWELFLFDAVGSLLADLVNQKNVISLQRDQWNQYIFQRAWDLLPNRPKTLPQATPEAWKQLLLILSNGKYPLYALPIHSRIFHLRSRFLISEIVQWRLSNPSRKSLALAEECRQLRQLGEVIYQYNLSINPQSYSLNKVLEDIIKLWDQEGIMRFDGFHFDLKGQQLHRKRNDFYRQAIKEITLNYLTIPKVNMTQEICRAYITLGLKAQFTYVDAPDYHKGFDIITDVTKFAEQYFPSSRDFYPADFGIIQGHLLYRSMRLDPGQLPVLRTTMSETLLTFLKDRIRLTVNEFLLDTLRGARDIVQRQAPLNISALGLLHQPLIPHSWCYHLSHLEAVYQITAQIQSLEENTLDIYRKHNPGRSILGTTFVGQKNFDDTLESLKSELPIDRLQKKVLTILNEQSPVQLTVADKAVIRIFRFYPKQINKSSSFQTPDKFIYYFIYIITTQGCQLLHISFKDEQEEERYRTAFDQHVSYSLKPKRSKPQLTLYQIYEKLWKDVDLVLLQGGIKEAFYCPDGIYHYINLYALKNAEGTYLLDRCIAALSETAIGYTLYPMNAAELIPAAYPKQPIPATTSVKQLLAVQPDFDYPLKPQTINHIEYNRYDDQALEQWSRQKKYSELDQWDYTSFNKFTKLIQPEQFHVPGLKQILEKLNPEHRYWLTLYTHGNVLKNSGDSGYNSGLLCSGFYHWQTCFKSKNQHLVSFESVILSPESILQMDWSKIEGVLLLACWSGWGQYQTFLGPAAIPRALRLAGVKHVIYSLSTVSTEINKRWFEILSQTLNSNPNKLIREHLLQTLFQIKRESEAIQQEYGLSLDDFNPLQQWGGYTFRTA